MTAEPCTMHVSSFDLSKAITFSKFFCKVKLSPSARLVLRCLIDFWNPNKGLVFPGQEMIAECTGVSPRSITSAVDELRNAGIILTTKRGTHLNYHLTRYFFELAEIAGNGSKNCGDKAAKIAGTCHEQNNRNKNNNKRVINFNREEGVNYLSAEPVLRKIEEEKEQSCSPLDFDREQAIEYLANLPIFLKDSYFAKELRKKWNIMP